MSINLRSKGVVAVQTRPTLIAARSMDRIAPLWGSDIFVVVMIVRSKFLTKIIKIMRSFSRCNGSSYIGADPSTAITMVVCLIFSLFL